MKRIKIIIFIFICVYQINAEEYTFDFAWNIGSFGWGMNISSNESSGGFKIDLLNFYIEHPVSGIGVKFSPFNCWANYSFSKSQIHIINISLYYNLVSLGYNPKDEEILQNKIDNYVIGGSTYSFIGPFAALSYFEHNSDKIFNKNDFQLTLGMQVLLLFDSRLVSENSLPFGFQIFNIELGYKICYNDRNNFYFSIGIDVLTALFIISNDNRKSNQF